MYLDRQACTNSVDPDEMLQKLASHQGLYCLSLIQQFLDISGSKLNLFKYGKVSEYLLLGQTGLSKQCRPRSDATKHMASDPHLYCLPLN